MAEDKKPTPKTAGQSAAGDPFALENLNAANASVEDLGVAKIILNIPVDKPGRQDFFRVHPEPTYKMDGRIIKLEAEREIYLVTNSIAGAVLPETRLVQLATYLTRAGNLGLWPLNLPDEATGKQDTRWGQTARAAAEIAENKWVRIQANMSLGSYDVVTSDHIPDPVWPDITFQDILKKAFSGGRLIDSMEHPVLKQLGGG